MPMTLKRDDAALVFPEIWEGTLKAGPAELRLVFHVTRLKGGASGRRSTAPTRGPSGMKVDEVKLDKDTLTFAVKSIRGAYDGKLNEAGTEAVGKWKQGRRRRSPDARRRSRRRPGPGGRRRRSRPFPYDETRVTYANEAAGVTLAGTLTTPRGRGRSRPSS